MQLFHVILKLEMSYVVKLDTVDTNTYQTTIKNVIECEHPNFAH